MIDPLQFFTVKVGNGSGCLFQPLDSEYSYVLTAKHIFEEGDQVLITRQTVNEDGSIKNEDIEILEPPYRHIHEQKDAAIFKVKKVEGIALLLRADDQLSERKDYTLCGHPVARVHDNFSFRKNTLTIKNPVEFNYIEAQVDGNVSYDEINGQSGGGIIKTEESCFLLAGIQKRMAADDEVENLGNIHFAPLSFFDEIIEMSNGKLSPLFPPYIQSFESLITDIFPLPNLLIKEALIHKSLNLIAKKICEETSPNQILKDYQGTFLVKGTSKSVVYHKQLWNSLLELFTIVKLHGEDISFNNLSDFHKKRKLMIVDTDVWTKKLEDIYSSDLSEIEKGGSIIICATNETSTTKTEILSAELIVCDISTPVEEMNISITVEDPFTDLKLTNIYKFQDHIIRNAIELAQINSTNATNKIKELTNDII